MKVLIYLSRKILILEIDKLKQKFKNVIEIDVLENMSRDITSKKNELFESIDSFMDKIDLLQF